MLGLVLQATEGLASSSTLSLPACLPACLLACLSPSSILPLPSPLSVFLSVSPAATHQHPGRGAEIQPDRLGRGPGLVERVSTAAGSACWAMAAHKRRQADQYFKSGEKYSLTDRRLNLMHTCCKGLRKIRSRHWKICLIVEAAAFHHRPLDFLQFWQRC